MKKVRRRKPQNPESEDVLERRALVRKALPESAVQIAEADELDLQYIDVDWFLRARAMGGENDSEIRDLLMLAYCPPWERR